MSFTEVIQYWVKSARLDLEAAESLLKNKKYTHCLFFGHLCLEKIFKAYFVHAKKQHAPYTHDLMKLAHESELVLPPEFEEWLPEISTFNIRTRYLDAKFHFYKKCTAAFTRRHFGHIQEIYRWVLKNKGL